MYRCKVCDEVSEPRHKMRRHVIYHVVRGLRQIEREVPVCAGCQGLLGKSNLEGLKRRMLAQQYGGQNGRGGGYGADSL